MDVTDVPDLKGNLTARYPTQFKKTVVRYAERFNNREAERTFGIAESNIRRWRKLKSMLFSDRLLSDSEARGADDDEDDGGPRVNGEVGGGSPNCIEDPNADVNKQSEMPQKPNDNDEVCLRWNSHHHNMKSMFPILLQREQFVDVTLTSEGKVIKCHKLILSSCSTYFDNMLSDVPPNQHAIIFLNTIPFWLLKILVDFMYTGEVHIDQNKLQDLLGVAEILQIKGLTGKSKDEDTPKDSPKDRPQKPAAPQPKPAAVNTPQQKPTVPPPLKPKVEPKQVKVEEVETKVVPNKRDAKQQPPPPPPPPVKLKVIKLQNADMMPLLKPVYIEDGSLDGSRTKDSPKKVGVRRMKKRKSSDHEPSPPPILYRKGTKSRPHVKVPKYYHNDYEDLDSINVLSLVQDEETTAKMEKHKDKEKSEYDLDKVKTEPVDADDTEVLYTMVSEDEDATTPAAARTDDWNPENRDDDVSEPNVAADK